MREKLTEQGIDVAALVPTVDVSADVLDFFGEPYIGKRAVAH